MKKLTSALLATAFVATAALAGDAGKASPTGFYLGVNVGAANTNVKTDWNNGGGLTTSRSTAEQISQNTKIDAGKMGWLFGAFAGYGMGFGNGGYVGLELMAGFDTTKLNPLNDSASGAFVSLGKITTKRTSYYGLAPRIGYMITPSTMAYVRLGLEFGKWQTQLDPIAAAVDANTTSSTTAAQVSASKAAVKVSKNRVNFAPGFGFETYISKNMFVRAEYSYMFGPKMTLNYPVAGLSNVYQFSGNSLVYNQKVTQHAVKLGLGYKF